MKNRTKVFAALVAAALSVSGVSVYAAEETQQTAEQERPAVSEKAGAAKGKFRSKGKFAAGVRTERTEEEKAAKIESIKKALEEKLADGKITQKQYDEAVAKLESGELRLGGKGFGGNREKPAELTEEEKVTKSENIKKALEEKLADGKITQEQYDEAVAKLESGELRFGGRNFGGDRDKQPGKRGFGKGSGWGNREQPEELTEEEKAARLETMKENRKKALDEKLADGKITQEQYDEAVAKLEAGELRFGGRNFGGNRGKQPGKRGFGKGFAKNAEQPADQTEN